MKRVSFLGQILLAISFGALSSSMALAASAPQDCWPSARERGKYQVRIASTGKILWEVNWETNVTDSQGKKRIEVREEGEGQPLKYKQPMRWEKEMVFRDPMQVESVRSVRWKQTGELFNRTDIEMDALKGQVMVQELEGMSESGRPVWLPWSPQLLPNELLFHWVRTLPFEGDAPSAECTLLISADRRFRMQAQVRGTEIVTTPAGTFACYRVELSPQLPAPLRALAPKMSLWCASQPPHFWVRYEGPVGGPGSPRAVIELVKFEQGTAG